MKLTTFVKKRSKSLFMFLFLTLSLLKISFSIDGECPRDRPILKGDNCTSDYCTPEEYLSDVCKINNHIAKVQFLNDFELTDDDYTTHISSTVNEYGIVFITAQEVTPPNNKYIFGLYQDGEGIFYNKTSDSFSTFSKVILPEMEYTDNERYVEIDGKGYLLSAPQDDYLYLIDYRDDSYIRYSIKPSAEYSDAIVKFSDYEYTYFVNYVYCKDKLQNNCFNHMKIFFLNDFTEEAEDLFTVDLPVEYGSRSTCLLNDDYYIQCLQQVKEGDKVIRQINLYVAAVLKNEFSYVLEENDYSEEIIFDSMIKLRNDVYVIAYSSAINEIKVLLKVVNVIENKDEFGNASNDTFEVRDLIQSVPEIYINDDGKYNFENSETTQNSLTKLDDSRFVIFLVDSKKDINSRLVVLVFNIYNGDKNINVRHYTIDFGMYNLYITGEAQGFYLSDYLGLSIGFSVKDKDVIDMKSGFMVFGYVNSTDPEIVDTYLFENKTYSMIDVYNYVYEMENNLFGYTFVGIKITDLPEEDKAGIFIENETQKKIKVNDYVNSTSRLRFILSNKYRPGTYIIRFAGIVREPDYDVMNEFAEKIEYYPKKSENEEKYYKPRELVGRHVNYRFKLGDCHENCETCIELSGEEYDQKCTKCKEDFYFVENTYNCFNGYVEGHYFDKKEEVYKKCHENCTSCFGPEINELQMNCQSCDYTRGFKLYESTNCLKCPKYVNYLQTECIDQIPDGYFLKDDEKKTLGKCHPACKTCDAEPYFDGEMFHMNCMECKLNIPNWPGLALGFCPGIIDWESYEIEEELRDDEEKEEEEINYNCPVEKPIFRDGECVLDYCTVEDFLDRTCYFSNAVIRRQWMNNFHIFSEGYNYDISANNNEKGDLFLSTIKETEDDNHFYLYGFHSNGTSIYCDRFDGRCYNLLQIELDVGNSPINTKYFSVNDQEYLISAVDNYWLYVFDYKNFDYTTIRIEPPASYSDTIIKLDDDSNLFFLDYVYCDEENFYTDCYIGMKIIEFNSYSDIKPIDEITLNPKIPIKFGTKLTCIKNDQSLIQCMFKNYDSYSDSYSREIHFFSPENLNEIYSIVIESDDYNEDVMIDEMSKLKKNTYILAYSSGEDQIKLAIKTFTYSKSGSQKYKITDYIPDLSDIIINEDSKYSFTGGDYDRNSLLVIDEDKFALFLKENTGSPNANLLILLCTIYTNNSNKFLVIKHYMINFDLYNFYISGNIRGYHLNDFIGVSLGLTLKDEPYETVNYKFMTFGYMNATEINETDTSLNFNNSKSIIVLRHYISRMEDNLFGYNFLGITILSLPPEKAGYFVNNRTNAKVKEDDIFNFTTVLRFIKSDNFDDGVYSIKFAGIVKEPEYDRIKEYTRRIDVYPKSVKSNSEKSLYKPKILTGKIIDYKFKLNHCYGSCEICKEYSKDDNSHQCTKCANGYHSLIGTTNCYKTLDHYYVDPETNTFKKCNSTCKSCNGPALSKYQNNCNACDNGFKLYDSSNCLNCSRYVNYLQTECIDRIPRGYYLLDEDLGTIGKCHPLCKTCMEGPYTDFDEEHMNCITCRYRIPDWYTTIEGNCPGEGDYNEEEEDEETEDKDEGKYDNKCPRNTPILKDGKCQLTYCDEDQYDDEVCIIGNKYTRIQWMNKFNYFGKNGITYSSLDKSEKGLYLFAQRIFAPTIDKYIYAFDPNGHEHFYDDEYEEFYSYKENRLPFGEIIHNIKYLNLYNEEFLLSTHEANSIYLMNLRLTSAQKIDLDKTAYRNDVIFTLKENKDILFSDTIVCDNKGNNCKLNLRNYDLKNLSFEVLAENVDTINVNNNTKVTCNQNPSNNFIQCVYTMQIDKENNAHVLGIYDSVHLTLVKTFSLENDYYKSSCFDSMIQLNDNTCVIAYSIERDIIKVLFKNLTLENKELSLKDFITEIPFIKIGGTNYYFREPNPANNLLYKINEKKFAMVVKNYNNILNDAELPSALVIYMFTIFNNNKNINVRNYEINFELYDMYISGGIKGYDINGFFGLLIDLTMPGHIYSNTSAFMTFGYINTTEEESPEDGTIILHDESIVLSDYIKKIENNLFGYEFIGVKILSIPQKQGHFIEVNQGVEIFENDTMGINSELEFVFEMDVPKGVYSIIFAGILQEPDYATMNNLSYSLESYPKNSNVSEELFYTPQILIGKPYNFSFIIDFNGELPDIDKETEDDEPKIDENYCPFDRPIYESGICYSTYCKDEEFEDKTCIIANKKAKTQWLNNFHLFDDLQASYITYDINNKGELFLLAQKEEEGSVTKYLMAFDFDGSGLFIDKVTLSDYCYKKFNFASPGFIDRINYVEIDDEGYLLTTINGKVNYLIDYKKNEILSRTSNVPSIKSDSIFLLLGERFIYFTDFLYCENMSTLKNCHIYFKTFNMTSRDFNIISNEDQIQNVNGNKKFKCLMKEMGYIICLYTITSNNADTRVLSVIDQTDFSVIKLFVLNNKTKNDETFDDMIQLDPDITVLAYSTKPDLIKVTFKKISVSENDDDAIINDYIPNIPYININEDSLYEFEGGNVFKNSMTAITETKFAILVNDYKNDMGSKLNSRIIIFIFTLFNSNSNVNVRHYPINLKLYNVFVDGDIRGYTLGDYFGLFAELTSPKSSYIGRAAFMTFGFVNATAEMPIIENTKSLIYTKSAIRLKNFFTGIENNLFGYELDGIIILFVPPAKAGYFINISNNRAKIKEDEIVSMNTQLKFIENAKAPKGTYSIVFAPILKEPEYVEMNELCSKLEKYPKDDDTEDEGFYYIPNYFLGKQTKYSFLLGDSKDDCYQNCKTCLQPSKDYNNQYCKTCKSGFYFVYNTTNCYDEKLSEYYFDNNKQMFMPCHENCYKCSRKELNHTNAKKMSCLSCKGDLKFYSKSTNCLNCLHYVDYNQTECIDEIPSGYYLKDLYLGIIDKCYKSCKTCQGPEYLMKDGLHMNCLTCLYNNSKFKSKIRGNCPSVNEGEEGDDEGDYEEDGNGYLVVLWIVISLAAILIIVGIVVVFIKCYKNKKEKEPVTSNYTKVHGNIAMDEDESLGI